MGKYSSAKEAVKVIKRIYKVFVHAIATKPTVLFIALEKRAAELL